METTKCNKLILADDHILLRDALAKLIAGFKEFTVVATAANGYEVIEIIETGVHVDILLMDLHMPEMDGFETAKRISKQYPHIKIVILSMNDNEMALIRLLQTGIAGFLKKDINVNELNNALLTIAAGEYYFSHKTAIKIATLLRQKTNSHYLSSKELFLNENEIEFLKLACTDMTYPEIGRAMHLTPRNVENYRRALFTKLEVDSRVGLAICAVKNGIITL